jgi:peroxiredoxin
MKQITLILGIAVLSILSGFSQGYNVGDKASDFKLKSTDGKIVSLSNYPEAKGFVVIFTCNHCPYAQAYQDRIIALDKKYKLSGYPVIAISSNDPTIVPEDSYENMILRSKEKGYTFPYLFDEKQEVYKIYGALKTPHVYLLQKSGSNLLVKYIGAIDDNYQDATKVSTPYLANALEALLAGKLPDPSFTKAIGCSIKDKSAVK